MHASTVPTKTPAGQSELDTRRLRLSQRHRTVLLLVDGRRSEVEVRRLAEQAGVAEACIEELLALGLIDIPGRLPAGPHGPAAASGAQRLKPAAAPRPAPSMDAPLPASASLAPDSGARDLQSAEAQAPISWFSTLEANDDEIDDPVFARARDILVRMVKTEAPVAGSLTLLRLRRARSRAELGELLDEVRSHLGKRQRTLAAAQSLASVRQLLSPSFDSTQPIA